MTLLTNKIKTEAEKKAEEIERHQKRFDEITNWLVDNPFMHPDWDKMVNELNALGVKMAMLNGDKIQQNTEINY